MCTRAALPCGSKTRTARLQEGKRIFDRGDMAAEKLFTGVSPSVWQKRTFLIFYHLLDNYERNTGIREEESAREKKETWDFLRACMQTRPMQYCFRYLVAKVRAPPLAWRAREVRRRPVFAAHAIVCGHPLGGAACRAALMCCRACARTARRSSRRSCTRRGSLSTGGALRGKL